MRPPPAGSRAAAKRRGGGGGGGGGAGNACAAPTVTTYVTATLDGGGTDLSGAPALAGAACVGGVCQAALGVGCSASFSALYVDRAPAVFRVRCSVAVSSAAAGGAARTYALAAVSAAAANPRRAPSAVQEMRVAAQPADAADGAATVRARVELYDAGGNLLAYNDAGAQALVVSVALACATTAATCDATLSGTTTAAVAAGAASFADLAVALAPGGLRAFALRFSLGTLRVLSNPFHVAAAAASAALWQLPSLANRAGVPLAAQPVLAFLDPDGRVARHAAAPTHFAAAAVAGGGATLAGRATCGAARGLCAFTDLRLVGPAGTYSLVFTPSPASVAPVTLAGVALAAGPAAALALTRQPGLGGERVEAGRPFLAQPAVEARDAGGNRAADFAGAVVAVVRSAPAPAGRAVSLGGNGTAAAAAGVAAFTDLALNVAGRCALPSASSSSRSISLLFPLPLSPSHTPKHLSPSPRLPLLSHSFAT
jgi:hypothetical protein